MADEITTETPELEPPFRTRQEPAESFQAFVDELRWTKPLREDIEPAHAASVVLCQLERRLTGDRREELLTHLPQKLQRLLESCQRIEGAPSEHKGASSFFVDVQDLLQVEPSTAEQIVGAVFTALRDRLPDDDVRWVASQLPPGLDDYWRRPI